MRSLKEWNREDWLWAAIGWMIVLGIAVAVLAESDALGDEFKTIALIALRAVMGAGLLSIIPLAVITYAKESGANWGMPKRVVVFVLVFMLQIGLFYGCDKAGCVGNSYTFEHDDEGAPYSEGWRR